MAVRCCLTPGMLLQERRRVLIESNMHSAFPVHAMGRGGKLEPARRPIVQHASGGRKGRFL